VNKVDETRLAKSHVPDTAWLRREQSDKVSAVHAPASCMPRTGSTVFRYTHCSVPGSGPAHNRHMGGHSTSSSCSHGMIGDACLDFYL